MKSVVVLKILLVIAQIFVLCTLADSPTEDKKDEQAQTNKTVLQSKWQLQKFSSQLWKQLCQNDINCGGASESGREYVNAITPTRLQCFYWIIIGIIQTCYGVAWIEEYVIFRILTMWVTTLRMDTLSGVSHFGSLIWKRQQSD